MLHLRWYIYHFGFVLIEVKAMRILLSSMCGNWTWNMDALFDVWKKGGSVADKWTILIEVIFLFDMENWILDIIHDFVIIGTWTSVSSHKRIDIPSMSYMSLNSINWAKSCPCLHEYAQLEERCSESEKFNISFHIISLVSNECKWQINMVN